MTAAMHESLIGTNQTNRPNLNDVR